MKYSYADDLYRFGDEVAEGYMEGGYHISDLGGHVGESGHFFFPDSWDEVADIVVSEGADFAADFAPDIVITAAEATAGAGLLGASPVVAPLAAVASSVYGAHAYVASVTATPASVASAAMGAISVSLVLKAGVTAFTAYKLMQAAYEIESFRVKFDSIAGWISPNDCPEIAADSLMVGIAALAGSTVVAIPAGIAAVGACAGGIFGIGAAGPALLAAAWAGPIAAPFLIGGAVFLSVRAWKRSVEETETDPDAPLEGILELAGEY